MEVWKGIPGIAGYEASTEGRIRSVKTAGRTLRGRVFSPGIDLRGYRRVSLMVDGKSKTFGVHRLVCLTFHGEPPSAAHQAAHTRDPNPGNNAADNLRWATPRENASDQLVHGTRRRRYKNAGVKTWADLREWVRQ